jgi:phage shock protein A
LPAGRDDIQAKLDAATAGSDVEEEVARMKEQLPAAAAPPALGAASSPAQPAAPPEKENPS